MAIVFKVSAQPFKTDILTDQTYAGIAWVTTSAGARVRDQVGTITTEYSVVTVLSEWLNNTDKYNDLIRGEGISVQTVNSIHGLDFEQLGGRQGLAILVYS